MSITDLHDDTLRLIAQYIHADTADVYGCYKDCHKPTLAVFTSCKRMQAVKDVTLNIFDFSVDYPQFPSFQFVVKKAIYFLSDTTGLKSDTLEALHLDGSPLVAFSLGTVFLHLSCVTLQGCIHLEEIDGVARCPSLRELDLEDCFLLKDFSPLSKCSALRSLTVSGCPYIKDVDPLQHCTELETFHMRGCIQVADLSPLQHTKIAELDVQEVMITAHLISGLKLCPTLRMLYMTCGYTSPDASLDALPGVVEVTLCPTGASDMEDDFLEDELDDWDDMHYDEWVEEEDVDDFDDFDEDEA